MDFETSCYYVKLVNDTLYFVKDGPHSGLYKMDTDGNNYTRLSNDDMILWMDLVDNWLVIRGRLENATIIEAIDDYHKTGSQLLELIN